MGHATCHSVSLQCLQAACAYMALVRNVCFGLQTFTRSVGDAVMPLRSAHTMQLISYDMQLTNK